MSIKQMDIDNMDDTEFELNNDQLFHNILELFRDVEHFKKYFFTNLYNIDTKYDDLAQAALFVSEGEEMIKAINKLYKNLDEYANFLFDNTDRMKENDYIEKMDNLKIIKSRFDEEKDKSHLQVNILIAKIATEAAMGKIKKKKSNKGKSMKKLNKIYCSTPLKYNKLEILLNHFKVERPNMTIKDFFQILNFSCYGISGIRTNDYDNNQTIEEINDINGIDIYN